LSHLENPNWTDLPEKLGTQKAYIWEKKKCTATCTEPWSPGPNAKLPEAEVGFGCAYGSLWEVTTGHV